MDLKRAYEIVRDHRPRSWLLRWFGVSSCRQCAQRWPCYWLLSARAFLAAETPEIPPEWKVPGW